MPAIDTRIMIAGMRVSFLSMLSLSLLAACGGGEGVAETEPGSDPSASSSEAPSASDTPPPGESSGRSMAMGTVEGIVRLAPGTSLPSYPQNPMVSVGASASLPDECPRPNDDDARPVTVGASGGLTNLVIVATGDRERWPDRAPPQTRPLRIERCRLTPRTLVAQRGDTVHLENETMFPFFPDLGTGFSRALLSTDPLDLVLDQGGVRTISCGFSNACGRTEVVTLYHPVFAVSDAEGRFRMTNVPADQDVRVTAWHPLFQEIGGQVRVSAGGTATLELVITPNAPPVPAPVAETPPRDPNVGDIPE